MASNSPAQVCFLEIFVYKIIFFSLELIIVISYRNLTELYHFCLDFSVSANNNNKMDVSTKPENHKNSTNYSPEYLTIPSPVSY